MLTLDELQEQFQSFIIKHDQAFIHHVNSTTNAPSDIRLKIYSEAYFLRLLEVLQKDYPGVHTLLGDDQFYEMAKKYLKKHPSIHRSVRWFGKHLPSFLNEEKEYSSISVLHDMAIFEWAMSESFDCADETTCTLQDLQKISPENWANMQFKFSNSFRILNLAWNVPLIWKKINDQVENITPQKEAETISWIIWRKEFQVNFRSLTTMEYAAIATVMQEKTFGDLCEHLCHFVSESQVAMDAVTLLKTWVTDHMITEIISH